MECWLRDFFKKANIWEWFLVIVITGIGIYVIVMPVMPKLNLSVRENLNQEKKPEDLIILYKDISSPKDIVPINCSAVLPIVYKNAISLKSLPIVQRKKKFIDMILPSILIVNYKIQKTRDKIIKIYKKLELQKPLTDDEEKFLNEILDKYKASSIKELLEKVNTQPPSLIIAQAAIESGWGTSRFFTQANNIFGVWTFDKKNASKIKARGANVYLKKYKNLLESIEDYYYSINVSWAYKKLRKVRLISKDPLKLADYLDKYSTLRDIYVKRVKAVIKQNNLTFYDNCKLDKSYISQ